MEHDGSLKPQVLNLTTGINNNNSNNNNNKKKNDNNNNILSEKIKSY